MKEMKKIKLHNLSQAEIADKEMNLLKGGSGIHICVSVCMDAICKCAEDGSGNFSTSESTIETYASSSQTEEGYSQIATQTPPSSGGEPGGTGILTV